MARYLRRTTKSFGHSHLSPPTVVAQPRQPPPIRVYTTQPVHRNEAGLDRRAPYSRLRPPAVIGYGIVYPGIGKLLTVLAKRCYENNTSRRVQHYKLSPPTVVGGGIAFYGPRRRLTRTPRQAFAYQHSLRPPVVVRAEPQFAAAKPLLATRTRDRVATVKSRLAPPQVVNPEGFAEAFYGPRTHLARIVPPKVNPDLAPPFVVAQGDTRVGGVMVVLAPQPKAQTTSRLAPPVVVAAAQAFYGPQIALAASKRGQPRSFLRPPVIPPLAEPTRVALAPQRRGAPRSLLKPPTVVFTAVELSGPEVSLAASSRLGRQQHAQLAPPTVVFTAVELSGPEITLAPSRRGRPLPRLAPPTVVGAPTLFFGPLTKLVRIRPRPTTTALGVFPPQAVVHAPVSVWLTYSRRGQPVSRLSPPVVVAPAPLPYPVAVTLAPQTRGTPLPRLVPPAVVGAGIVFRPVEVTLTRIRPPKTTALLKPPAVVQPVTLVFYGPAVTLSYSRRGRPLSELRAPAVVGAGIAFYGPQVQLANQIAIQRQQPRQTIWLLRPPTVLRLQEFDLSLRRIRTELADSLRGRPTSELRPPVVVGLAVEIYGPEVTLAPSRFPTPQSQLLPPAVVGQPPFRGLLTHLAYSRRGTPMSLPPSVAPGLAPFRPILTSLAPSSRGVPKSRLLPPSVTGLPPFRGLLVSTTRIEPQPTAVLLAPPTVVAQPPFRSLLVHLAPSSRGEPFSALKPPSVIGAGIVFRPVQVQLVAITPSPTQTLLRPPVVTITEVHGDVVCDDDTVFGADCGETPIASVQAITTASDDTIGGSDEATA